MITLEKAKELYECISDEKIQDISTLEGGMAGMVFLIKINSEESIIFKLYEKVIETKESVDDRVYGSNHSNLTGAHKLLSENNIGTFDLLSTGDIEDYTYATFTLLEGIEPNQEIISDEVYIHTLASIHSITREYQGWVCNTKPYDLNWRDAFQESIYSRLSDTKKIISDDTHKKVREYIDNHIGLLECPNNYVLSHLDGLQALFYKTNEGWSLSGVIDVEDYQFTDQRFVMAGITLGELLGRYKLPDNFLDVYQGQKMLDVSFKDFEKLFQIYYLLVWIRVLNNCKMSGEEEKCQNVLKDMLND